MRTLGKTVVSLGVCLACVPIEALQLTVTLDFPRLDLESRVHDGLELAKTELLLFSLHEGRPLAGCTKKRGLPPLADYRFALNCREHPKRQALRQE